MAIAHAWVVRDTLRLRLIDKDTVFIVKDSIRTEIKEVTKVVQQPCKERPVLNKLIILAVIGLVILIVAKIRF